MLRIRKANSYSASLTGKRLILTFSKKPFQCSVLVFSQNGVYAPSKMDQLPTLHHSMVNLAKGLGVKTVRGCWVAGSVSSAIVGKSGAPIAWVPTDSEWEVVLISPDFSQYYVKMLQDHIL